MKVIMVRAVSSLQVAACSSLWVSLKPLSESPFTLPRYFNMALLNMLNFVLDKAAEILVSLCMRYHPGRPLLPAQVLPQETSTWLLKANVTVYRHADRTPKQKLKLYVSPTTPVVVELTTDSSTPATSQ